jgi:hypothetical protein
MEKKNKKEKQMKKQLEQGFEVIVQGLGVIARVIGEDPPNDKKDNPKSDHPKYDHPATFRGSLREQDDSKWRMK